MAKCSICGGGLGIWEYWKLKDGNYCKKCKKKFDAVGFVLGETWNSLDFTVQDAKSILEKPEEWRSVAKERLKTRVEHANALNKLSEQCLICGESLDETIKYFTTDHYALCHNCRCAAITISPKEFMKEKDKFIERHDSQFFKNNMEHLVHPHKALWVNFTNQSFYYAGQLIDDVDCVFSFDSVVKFETATQTYEVTVGKKGHPIARALVGGAVFGGAGAIVGAMTTKDTRHKEKREGLEYVCIYHRASSNPNVIMEKYCTCLNCAEVVQLENCLKRVFEYREDEQKKLEESDKASVPVEPVNNYGELVELKKLLDMGVITQEEFDTKKKQILGL